MTADQAREWKCHAPCGPITCLSGDCPLPMFGQTFSRSFSDPVLGKFVVYLCRVNLVFLALALQPSLTALRPF